MKKRLIIIGAGASGLFASLWAGRYAKTANIPLDITVLEKNERAGKKLLATGNGKCNMLNSAVAYSDYYESSDFIKCAIPFTSADLLKDFTDMGMLTFCDSQNRIYPKSESAASVLNSLRFEAQRVGVKIKTNECVTKIEKSNVGYAVTANNIYTCDSVIIATGTSASVKENNTADIFKSLGVRYIEEKPALSPVRCKENIKSLKGVRVKGSVTLDKNYVQTGEIQFSQSTISGICVMNLSRFVKPSGSKLEIDAVPDLTKEELYRFLKTKVQKNPNLKTEFLCDTVINKNLSLYILRSLHIPADAEVKKLLPEKIKTIAETVKKLTFTVYPFENLSRAQVATGGVDTKEIDCETMALLKHPNIYVCGEEINVDGPCGGYNLFFAFASGKKAAKSAVKNIEV